MRKDETPPKYTTDWYGKPIAPLVKNQQRASAIAYGLNPMIVDHGPGPKGTHCVSCKHFIRFVAQREFCKCEPRCRAHDPKGNAMDRASPLKHGQKCDHRKTWETCGLYELNTDGPRYQRKG
jgi:hypothetical protein